MNLSTESLCLMVTVGCPSFFLTDTTLSALSWYGFMMFVGWLLVDWKRMDEKGLVYIWQNWLAYRGGACVGCWYGLGSLRRWRRLCGVRTLKQTGR